MSYKSLIDEHSSYKRLSVDHIALMGLEYIGFAVKNFEDIHISPLDYKIELYEAIDEARRYNLPISIYNLPPLFNSS